MTVEELREDLAGAKKVLVAARRRYFEAARTLAQAECPYERGQILKFKGDRTKWIVTSVLPYRFGEWKIEVTDYNEKTGPGKGITGWNNLDPRFEDEVKIVGLFDLDAPRGGRLVSMTR